MYETEEQNKNMYVYMLIYIHIYKSRHKSNHINITLSGNGLKQSNQKTDTVRLD